MKLSPHFHLVSRLRMSCRLRLKRDGTHAETRFRRSAKRTSPLKSAGASVHSTTGSRGVRISVSNAGYTILRGSVKGTGYPLHSPVSHSLPLPCVTVCHHVSPGLYLCFPSMTLREVQRQLHLRVTGQRLHAVRRILPEFRYVSNSDAVVPYFVDFSHSRIVVSTTTLFICHGFDIFHNLQKFYIWSFLK
jgi:hypothetical protein